MSIDERQGASRRGRRGGGIDSGSLSADQRAPQGKGPRRREAKRAIVRPAVTKAKSARPNRGITHDENIRDRCLRYALAAFDPTRPRRRSMNELKKMFGVSVPAVWSVLEQAEALGIIEYHVNEMYDKIEVARLEQAVLSKYEHFGLRQVLLVPGFKEMLEERPVEELRQVHRHVADKLARKAASYLDGALAKVALRQAAAKRRGRDVRPFQVGVAWGPQIAATARVLHSRERAGAPLEMKILPIKGPTGLYNKERVEANDIASDMAEAYDCESAPFPGPAFAPAAEAEALMQIDFIRRTLARITKVDLVLTGMGPIVQNANGDVEVRFFDRDDVNEEFVRGARRNGAVGDICGALFNRQGEPVRSEQISIGLGLDDLKRIAGDPARQVVLISGGDRRRFEPMQAAVRGRLVSVLITDTYSARWLAGELNAPRSG